MNLELDEEYGAGFEGTKELLYKYLKDTPGQKIVKYMDKTNTEFEEKSGETQEMKELHAVADENISEESEILRDSEFIKYAAAMKKILSIASRASFKSRLMMALTLSGKPGNAIMSRYIKALDVLNDIWEFEIINTLNEETQEEKELLEMKELYAVVDENNVVLATASNEQAAKRSISSSELPPLSVKDKTKLRIVKTRKQAEVGELLKEETATPTLEEARRMKIVSLATGSTDSDSLLSYVCGHTQYSSVVELKENFNKYIQSL